MNEVTLCNICMRDKHCGGDNHDRQEHMTEIIPGLYIGCYGNATNISELLYFKIERIVNCAAELNNCFVNSLGYKKFYWLDDLDFDVSNDLIRAADEIHNSLSHKQNVLVHCQMGRSRSVTAVLAYLVKYHKMSVSEALSLVSNKRDIGVNASFLAQLELTLGAKNQK